MLEATEEGVTEWMLCHLEKRYELSCQGGQGRQEGRISSDDLRRGAG